MKKEEKKVVNVYFSINEIQELLNTGEVTIKKTKEYQVNARLQEAFKPGKFIVKVRGEK